MSIMPSHATLKGEGSWQRRPGTEQLHLGRGCGGGGGCYPALAGRVPHTAPRGKEQLWRLNPAQMYRDTPVSPTGADVGTKTGPSRHEGARCHGSGLSARAGRRDRPVRLHPRGEPPGAEPWPRRREGSAGEGRGMEGKGSGGSPGRPPSPSMFSRSLMCCSFG